MKPARSFWPLGIIGAFVLFTAGTAAMIVLACRSNTDLVAADYYDQEIRYQGRLDSLDRTESLATKAGVAYSPARRRITFTLPPEHAGSPAQGRIELYRPSAVALDRQFELEPDANGAQTLDAADLAQGLWRVRVLWRVAGRDYFLDRKLVIDPVAEPAGASRH